jgi:hypothetical protein
MFCWLSATKPLASVPTGMRWLRGDRLKETVRFRMLSTFVFLPQAYVEEYTHSST